MVQDGDRSTFLEVGGRDVTESEVDARGHTLSPIAFITLSVSLSPALGAGGINEVTPFTGGKGDTFYAIFFCQSLLGERGVISG